MKQKDYTLEFGMNIKKPPAVKLDMALRERLQAAPGDRTPDQIKTIMTLANKVGIEHADLVISVGGTGHRVPMALAAVLHEDLDLLARAQDAGGAFGDKDIANLGMHYMESLLNARIEKHMLGKDNPERAQEKDRKIEDIEDSLVHTLLTLQAAKQLNLEQPIDFNRVVGGIVRYNIQCPLREGLARSSQRAMARFQESALEQTIAPATAGPRGNRL